MQNDITPRQGRVGKAVPDIQQFQNEMGINLRAVPPFYTHIHDKPKPQSDGDSSDSDEEDSDVKEVNEDEDDYPQSQIESQISQIDPQDQVPQGDMMKMIKFADKLIPYPDWKAKSQGIKDLHVIGKMKLSKMRKILFLADKISPIHSVQYYTWIYGETKAVRGEDPVAQKCINTLGVSLTKEKMGLIAIYKYGDGSLPKYVCLEPAFDDFHDTYTFFMRFLPSDIYQFKIYSPVLAKVDQSVDDAVANYMGNGFRILPYNFVYYFIIFINQLQMLWI